MRVSVRTRAVLVTAAFLSATALGLGVALAGPDGSAPRKPGSAAAHHRTARSVLPAVPVGLAKREVGGSSLAGSGVVVSYGPGRVRALPRVPASAYVIANAATGAVLAAKDPHGLFPPASTLKVLTAIALLPRLNPDALVLATKQAASVEPNIVGILPGHKYRVADLFRALLLISANDAAVALTQATGSFATGMELINAEARHLQAYDMVAVQPNGLPAPGQVASAYDLALIGRQALAMPDFMRYDETLTATFPLRRHHDVALANQNYLLTQYPGGIGGKIGWTQAAEATYIGMARRHGVTLIVTVMHATPLTEITSAEKLLSWGFAMNGKVRPVGVLVPPLPGPPTTTAASTVPGAHVPRARTHAAPDAADTAAVHSRGIPLTDAIITGLWVVAIAGLVVWLRRWRRKRKSA